MSVQIGTLYRKSVRKDFNGNIIDLLDETNGGYIIKNRQVVNEERYKEILKVQEDKKMAAQAANFSVQASVPVEERNAAPSRIDLIEKEVGSIKDDIKTILSLLKKE